MTDYTFPTHRERSRSEFLADHPDAMVVAPGTIVEIAHRAYTVFGSGGATSYVEWTGSPTLIDSIDQGDNGFCGHYVSRVQINGGDAVYASMGDSIGGGRVFVRSAYIADARAHKK